MNLEVAIAALFLGLLGTVTPQAGSALLFLLYPLCFVAGFACGAWAKRHGDDHE